MNDLQDQQDATLTDPVTFAPPATDAWVFMTADIDNGRPFMVVTSAADFFFAERILGARGSGYPSSYHKVSGELGDVAFVTVDDIFGISISTTPTAAATTYCVKVIRHMDDVNY